MNHVGLNKIIKEKDILTVSDMAAIIWNEHYASILSKEQIEYMLENFQSPAAIKKAMDEGYEYFLITDENTPVGYISIKINSDTKKMFLSKIYLLAEHRGKGFAYDVINQLTEICRQKQLNAIWLTVNKDNISVERYKRIGFVITEPIVTDIGNGFIMDDYRMEKQVQLY